MYADEDVAGFQFGLVCGEDTMAGVAPLTISHTGSALEFEFQVSAGATGTIVGVI
mgnify:CR=1 FL=1